MKMKSFTHPNILSLIGVCVDAGPTPYIVMPFMANGSLLSYLRKERDKLLFPEEAGREEDKVRPLNTTFSSRQLCIVYVRKLP